MPDKQPSPATAELNAVTGIGSGAVLGGGLCRYCSKPVSDADAAVTHSYWQGMKFLCHKNCKAAGEKSEALECQTLDADCNDCRHYKRGTSAPTQISRYKNHKGEWVEIVYKPEIWIGGHCLKFDKPTTAYPKKWTGHECFEHRRGEPPNKELSHER